MAREQELGRTDGVRPGMTVRDAVERYVDEVTPTKKGARSEAVRLRVVLRDPLAAVTLELLNLEDVEAYRDRRLASVQKPSVTRELTTIKTVIRQAVKWRWLSAYPLDGLRSPGSNEARKRVFTDAEIAAIVERSGLGDAAGAVETRKQEIGLAFLVSLETAMRLGEILTLEWSRIDLDRRVVFLPAALTKGNRDREVPLSSRAVELFGRLQRDRERPFRVGRDAASVMFGRILKQAGVHGATFHDARRHAATNLAKKLDVMDLAKIGGWSDPAMLLRVYYRADAEALAKLLD